MRVIKEISYPTCKASIFYMNQKYIIKIEQGNLEQAYKISEIDYVIKDVTDIIKILDNDLLAKALEGFEAMATNYENALKDY